MLFLEEPADFQPALEVVGCFCEFEGRFLLLKRHPNTLQPNTWGIPSGKVESDEGLYLAMREAFTEETGQAASRNDFSYLRTVYVRYPGAYDFSYSIFSRSCIEAFIPDLAPEEHTEFRWVTSEEALQLPLVPDLDACIRLYYLS